MDQYSIKAISNRLTGMLADRQKTKLTNDEAIELISMSLHVAEGVLLALVQIASAADRQAIAINRIADYFDRKEG